VTARVARISIRFEACTVTDEMLRDVVFGDPACHTMTMYSKRIEILATRAVTVGGFS